MKSNDKVSQEAIDKLYTLKQEESKFNQLIMESKKNKKKSIITEMKTIDVGEVNHIKNEIE